MRTLSMGAELVRGGTHFRVFAPKRKAVAIVLAPRDDEPARTVSLAAKEGGFFEGLAFGASAGTRYWIRLDHDERLYPDPASRFQPEGPHGPSEIIDPSTYRWSDEGWAGPVLRGQVIYELHVGTFTKEGTYTAAQRELEELRSIGITMIELMPVAEFPGRFGWGYDGVDLYAPMHTYGRPDDLRAFVDRAHALGMSVILDVVYNHLGPSGNYLAQFSDHFFASKYENPWGEAIDFETDPSVRAYFVENAGYWIDEYHLDGFRLDATQAIYDASEKHVLAELGERARSAAGGRRVVVIAEDDAQQTRLVRGAERGGFALSGLWNDDFHHATRVALTGTREGYYSRTRGTPQELVSAIKWGFLCAPSLDLEAPQLIVYIQNHDQVANTAHGQRLSELTTKGRLRAVTLLQLLAPGTPLLFQGQEFGASAPFHFFADHEPELAELVKKGRLSYLEQFPSHHHLRFDPHDVLAFESCKLDFEERLRNRAVYDLHKDLLRLRREDPVFSAQRTDWLHGAVLGSESFVLRYSTRTGEDRLVLVNLGSDLDLAELAEPLLLPPEGRAWSVLFSTEDTRYGGSGIAPEEGRSLVWARAHSALVLAERA